jgi:hypothetical protein
LHIRPLGTETLFFSGEGLVLEKVFKVLFFKDSATVLFLEVYSLGLVFCMNVTVFVHLNTMVEERIYILCLQQDSFFFRWQTSPFRSLALLWVNFFFFWVFFNTLFGQQ